MRGFMVSALAGAALLGACGSPSVGAACTADSDCDDDLACNTEGAGGYCTKPCGPQNQGKGCPDGSRCNHLHLQSPDSVCVKLCEVKEDCREDQECGQIISISNDTRGCLPAPR